MEPLRNLLLAGLGAMSFSQEKLKGTLNTMIEKGELTREQGEQVISEWVQRGQSEQEEFSRKMSDEVNKVLSKLSLVPREEYEELVRRVEELERKASD